MLLSMRWVIHGEEEAWSNPWLSVRRLDVEQPDGRRFDYHAVRLKDIAAAVVTRDGCVLLMWRHRFLTDTWAWEIPMGIIEPGETPEAAAARELEEETGSRAGAWRYLGAFWTAPGFTSELMHLYLATELVPVHGGGLAPDEDERLELRQVPFDEAVAMVERGELPDAKTIAGLFWVARLRAAGEVRTASTS